MTDVGDFITDMRCPGRPGDEAIASLATRQHGVVGYRQLLDLGFGKGAIQRRVCAGRLHRLHQGVFAVGHQALRTQGTLMAAVLAGGPGAVISHRSAAAMWELLPTSGSTVEVTAPGGSRRGRSGIAVHRVRRLHADDRARRAGISVTSVARTLLDLVEVVQPRRLERALEEAERLRLLDLRAVQALCDRSRGRRGLRPLLALLADASAVGAPATRSELERRFLGLCRDAGLPPPAVNVIVAGFEVDAAWPAQRLVVELDGHAFHGTRAAFERDRVRDASLQLAGHRVLRVTHRRLEREPLAIVSTVRALLEYSLTA